MLEMNDPYAAIRSLALDAPMSQLDWYRRWSAPDSAVRYEDLTPEQQSIYQARLLSERQELANAGGGETTAGNMDLWSFGSDWGQSPELSPYRSKYERITDIGGGKVVARMQRPGMHKYDTMDVTYALDPSTGRYVMEGEPEFRREVSSMQQMVHDPFDAAAKFAGSAAALYGAATGVNALLGGAGGGFGAAEAGLLSGGDAGIAAASGSGGIGTLGTLPSIAAPMAPISAAGAVAPITAAQMAPSLTSLTLPALAAAPAMGGASAGGGSLLSKIPGPVGEFIAGNPKLSQGLFSLLGGALGGGGAFSSGGGGSVAPAGPAKQWTTPIQPAAYTAPQLWNPDTPVSAMSMGAGRFLGGK